MRITKQSIDYWGAVFWDAYLAQKGYFILGYTKSGTNWIRNLLRSYFDIDYPTKEGYSSSFFRKRVHHLHRFISSNYFNKKTVYMVRDGRDTIVSRYFTMIRQESQLTMKDEFSKQIGEVPSEENIVQLLPAYINFLCQYHGSSIDWKSHLEVAQKRNFLIIKYEDLRQDTSSTLKKVISYLEPNDSIDELKIKQAIDYCSIESEKKKKKIDTGFFRKDGGKSGTWKNYFSADSAKAFDLYAGDFLIQYGYEENHNWINHFS